MAPRRWVWALAKCHRLVSRPTHLFLRLHGVVVVSTAGDQACLDHVYTSVVLVVVDLNNHSLDVLAVVLDITSVLLEVYHQVGTHKQEGVVPNHAVQSSHIAF